MSTNLSSVLCKKLDSCLMDSIHSMHMCCTQLKLCGLICTGELCNIYLHLSRSPGRIMTLTLGLVNGRGFGLIALWSGDQLLVNTCDSPAKSLAVGSSALTWTGLGPYGTRNHPPKAQAAFGTSQNQVCLYFPRTNTSSSTSFLSLLQRLFLSNHAIQQPDPMVLLTVDLEVLQL